MNLAKGIGESLKDYKIRLLSNKDMYGLSFQQIADLINTESGETKNESTYRKWWSGYKEGVADAEKRLINSDELLQEYENKRIEAEKARMRFFDQRTAYNKNVRSEARFDELKNILLDSISSITPYESKFYNVVNSDNDLLVALNDIHFGANINNSWNIYNPDVAKERLEKYIKNIINIRNTHNSENCYICVNGDCISGNIHPTIQISNRENVVKQVMGVSELISWFVAELSPYFNNVYFSLVSGNHSRLSTKDNSPKDERLDDLIPWYVKARLSNIENLYFVDNTLDGTINIVNIRGLNYVNVHGDYDNFSSCEKLISMLYVPVYCVHMGHLHHNKTDWVQKYKVIMSGSLQGMDDYCISKRIFGKAQELVCVCNTEGILCTYDVDLQ
jgi:hypothetical protein